MSDHDAQPTDFAKVRIRKTKTPSCTPTEEQTVANMKIAATALRHLEGLNGLQISALRDRLEKCLLKNRI